MAIRPDKRAKALHAQVVKFNKLQREHDELRALMVSVETNGKLAHLKLDSIMQTAKSAGSFGVMTALDELRVFLPQDHYNELD